MKNAVQRFAVFVLGNLINAFGIAAFSIPNQFLINGTPGIGRIFNHYFNMDVTMVVLLTNVVMFVLGYLILGKTFAMAALISSTLFPLFLNAFLRLDVLRQLTDDRLMSAIYCGTLVGIGTGMVIRMGGCTGGTEVVPLVLNKKLNVPVAVGMYCFDLISLALQATFSGREQVLYGLLAVLLTSIVLNQVLVFGAGNVQVMIISAKFREINEMIQTQLVRGSTYIPIITGYEQKDQRAVLCVLPSRELNRLNRNVQQLDERAFIVIDSVREVRGKGFTLDR